MQETPQTPKFLVTSTTNSLLPHRHPLRICTQYHPPSPSQSNSNTSTNPIVLQMFVYTPSDVYFGEASSLSFNRELQWNRRYEELVKEVLGGRGGNGVVEFQAGAPKIRVYSEFQENSIRILLLSVDLICLHKDPIKHSQHLLKTVSTLQNQKLQQLSTHKRMQQAKIEQLDALQKETAEQFDFDINVAKDRFLSVINEAKQKLRPHFGMVDKTMECENSGTQTRTIYRINSEDHRRQSDNIYNLFD